MIPVDDFLQLPNKDLGLHVSLTISRSINTLNSGADKPRARVESQKKKTQRGLVEYVLVHI